MVGRISEKNISVPLNQTSSSSGIVPKEETFIQDSEDRPAPRLGVANIQDGFETVEQDDLSRNLILRPNTIIDPLGYPGEEWLWQE
jgi:hypothetical protein